MEDLTTLIEDSLTDAELPTEPTEVASDPIEAAPEPTQDAPVEAVPDPDAHLLEEAKPVAQDEFDKKFGLTASSSSGRENRIPYSRVKKITEKAVNDAKTEWEKAQQTGFVPSTKFAELETKTKDYEARLGQVAEFEKVMVKEPVRFLQMLYKQPGYAAIFDQLAGSAAQQPTAAQDQVPQAPVPDDMPQPDQDLSDGSKVYSLEGLKTLLAWQDKRTEARTTGAVLKQVEARYGPIEASFNSYQKIQAVIPQVQKQIEDARTWPLFNESEDDIVKALQTNPNWNLERAYQSVVYPKLTSEREVLANQAKVSKDTLRAEILKELKQAPRATSASVGQSRPNPVNPGTTGPRGLEDVIAESLKSIR